MVDPGAADALSGIASRSATSFDTSQPGTKVFTATATDADLPANTLSFSLDAGNPMGSAMTAAGVFTWTPDATQTGSFPVTVRVTDNGIPPLFDTELITLTISSGTSEFFAANGYVVLSVNYRGSSGRGAAYQKAIFADWGNKEVVDLLGAVDAAVAAGVADPDRLGLGGWSYGGILTDYTIATDPRFKAAVSGAGSALQLSMYGGDQYIAQYEQEIGPPWKARDLWLKISYPFFQVDRIKTPTLFMGGEKDFNVPIVGGEQMYQALKSLGVETQLVIYPGQFHGLTMPSYQRDRLERYVAWFDKHLKTARQQ